MYQNGIWWEIFLFLCWSNFIFLYMVTDVPFIFPKTCCYFKKRAFTMQVHVLSSSGFGGGQGKRAMCTELPVRPDTRLGLLLKLSIPTLT